MWAKGTTDDDFLAPRFKTPSNGRVKRSTQAAGFIDVAHSVCADAVEPSTRIDITERANRNERLKA